MTPSRIRDPLHLRVWFSRAPHTPEPGYARRRDRLVGTTVRRGGNRAKSWRRGDGPGLIGKSFSVSVLWRRREGVEPSGDLTIPRLVLKTSGTTGHLPSPLLLRGPSPGLAASVARAPSLPLRRFLTPAPRRPRTPVGRVEIAGSVCQPERSTIEWPGSLKPTATRSLKPEADQFRCPKPEADRSPKSEVRSPT